LDRIMPGWLLVAWYVLLLVGGVTGLAGCWWSRGQVLTGLLLETAAMSLLATGCCVYAIGLFAVSGQTAWTAGVLVAAISVSCAWRWVQLKADVRALWALPRGPG
jgi:hypothetical protein